MPPSSPDDALYVVARTTVERAGFQAKSPHRLVGNAMGADDANFRELFCQPAHLEHLGQVEIYNDNVCRLLLYTVSNLLDVASNYNILEVGMKTCSQVLGDDAI